MTVDLVCVVVEEDEAIAQDCGHIEHVFWIDFYHHVTLNAINTETLGTLRSRALFCLHFYVER